MTIHFLVQINKVKAPRINVARVIHDADGKRKLQSLGTLPDDLSLAYEMFNPQLDLDEQYQLENYIKNIEFNLRHFRAHADSVARELLYFPPAYHKAMMKLWQLAKAHQLDFNPHEVMLTALLNKGKAVERALNEKLDTPVQLLEGLNLDLHRFDKQTIHQRIHTGAQAIFKALVDSQKPLAELADTFNQLAAKHNKHAALQPHYLQNYANGPKRLPLWYVGIAMQMYQAMGKDVLTVLSLEQAINAWLSLKPLSIDASQAASLFIKDIGTHIHQDEVVALIHQRRERTS